MSRRADRRLPQGCLIDRSRRLSFTFEGRSYSGYVGDTLASALLANGVRVVGRSFKYHRPRGLMAAGAEEPNALMRIGEGASAEVNVRATEVKLQDGLVAEPVNCWPSVRFDVGAVNSLFSRFLSAGFYYKTFMWPSWHFYEGFIRRAAGLGRPASAADPDRYETVYAHCDVLVVGAGPAGLAAARAASAAGARVILAEQDFRLGGRLLWDEAAIDGRSAAHWLRRVEEGMHGQPETRILTSTTALGYFDHNALVLVEKVASNSDRDDAPRERLWQVRAKRVVLASGAIERPLVFDGNDRPGVMLATAARQYIRRFGVRVADRAVIVTNNDDAYETATALVDAGIEVAGVADLREGPAPVLRSAMAGRGIEILPNAKLLGADGRGELESVRIQTGERVVRLACDLLAMSGGMSPVIHLHTQSGGKPLYDERRACFVPGPPVQAEDSVGGAAGEFSLPRSLEEGHRAGERAAVCCGFQPASLAAPQSPAERERAPVRAVWRPGAGGSKAFVDFQNDVTAHDIALAARENYVSVEHLKRYTTLGMAPDQGKTSNVNALAIMADLTGRRIAETGTIRNRFPYTPVSIGALNGLAQGETLRPLRRMPAHDWHAAHGAVFEEYGGWARPAYYLRGGEEPHAAEQREARAVREAAGLFEGSPLGKIEIRGPDAAKFLDRIYANTISTLRVGKLRYGLMLNELGVIIDDGVVARFAEDHFQVGTTSGGAGRIAGWLEEWLQCEWPDLDVITAPVTNAWGVVTLTGPKARQVLDDVGVGISLAPDDFPHMTFEEADIAGMAARICRVSFTGEISYEINVPARQTQELWERLMAVGAGQGIAPVGIDAWMLLRTEKGYLHVGADTDGTTVPNDVGWGHVLRRTSDFIGKRSLSLPANCREDRPQLVGLDALGQKPLPIGAHLRAEGKGRGSEGYVTSSGLSIVTGRGVALAMVNGGRARLGETLDVYVEGAVVAKARVAPTCFYDPEGKRLDA